MRTLHNNNAYKSYSYQRVSTVLKPQNLPARKNKPQVGAYKNVYLEITFA